MTTDSTGHWIRGPIAAPAPGAPEGALGPAGRCNSNRDASSGPRKEEEDSLVDELLMEGVSHIAARHRAGTFLGNGSDDLGTGVSGLGDDFGAPEEEEVGEIVVAGGRRLGGAPAGRA